MTSPRRGSILLTSVWILFLVAFIALGLMRRSMLEARSFRNYSDQEKARAIAWAGLELAAARIASDVNGYDTVYECGIQLGDGDTPAKALGWTPGQGRLLVGRRDESGWTAGLEDEDGKLNLNAADPALLAAVLRRVGLGERQAEELASTVLGRRTPGGDFIPYRQPDDLLTVPGVTPELLERLRPVLTVYGRREVRVNVHTAPRIVLESLAVYAGMSEDGARELAGEIIGRRRGPDGKEGTADDEIFLARGMPVYPWSAGLHASRPGEVWPMFAFHHLLKADSRVLRARAMGKAGSSVVTLEAVFERGENGPPHRLAFHES